MFIYRDQVLYLISKYATLLIQPPFEMFWYRGGDYFISSADMHPSSSLLNTLQEIQMCPIAWKSILEIESDNEIPDQWKLWSPEIQKFRNLEIQKYRIAKSLCNKFLIQLKNPTWMSPYKRSPGPGLCSPPTLCSKTPDWWQVSVKMTVSWLSDISANFLHLEVEVAALVVDLVDDVQHLCVGVCWIWRKLSLVE